MKSKSVALIVIDPPYGAQTHGKKSWDVAWTFDFWKRVVNECFRVLVKGGHIVVFSSGKTIFDIHNNIALSYRDIFKQYVSFYRMIWKHSLDSATAHNHVPRSQLEDITVYFRTGEGKEMFGEGTL